jgi:hypothetical protein
MIYFLLFCPTPILNKQTIVLFFNFEKQINPNAYLVLGTLLSVFLCSDGEDKKLNMKSFFSNIFRNGAIFIALQTLEYHGRRTFFRLHQKILGIVKERKEGSKK